MFKNSTIVNEHPKDKISNTQMKPFFKDKNVYHQNIINVSLDRIEVFTLNF